MVSRSLGHHNTPIHTIHTIFYYFYLFYLSHSLYFSFHPSYSLPKTSSFILLSPPSSYPLSLAHIQSLLRSSQHFFPFNPIRQLFQTIQIFTSHIFNHFLYLQPCQLPLNRVINISKICPFSSTISFFHTNFHKSLYLNKLHNQKILQLIYQ